MALQVLLIPNMAATMLSLVIVYQHPYLFSFIGRHLF